MSKSTDDIVLKINNLAVSFHTEEGSFRAVDNVSLTLRRQQVLGLVGESGCGKSITCYSILRLIPPPGRIVGGEILLQGRDLLSLSESEMRRVRGNKISMVFQEPMTALNPVLTVGSQIVEVIRLHQRKTRREARTETLRMLDLVALPHSGDRFKQYPHQLSGGMRQRVLLAMALACRPSVLIADEPTTALDVTIQAQILELLLELKHELALSILLVTHDLGVVAELADSVAIMYTGKIVEEAPVQELFAHPLHPYTQDLLAAIPQLEPGEKPRRLKTIRGRVPSLFDLPSGCHFSPRCRQALPHCSSTAPSLKETSPQHAVSCLLYESGTEGACTS